MLNFVDIKMPDKNGSGKDVMEKEDIEVSNLHYNPHSVHLYSLQCPYNLYSVHYNM